MAIDWDKFQEDLDQLVTDAGKRTDAELASKMSSITRLTDEEIKKLFPDPADVKKLGDLMEIVKRSGEQADKINKLVANSEQYASVILTLLGKFA